jgi:hypothetical protein
VETIRKGGEKIANFNSRSAKNSLSPSGSPSAGGWVSLCSADGTSWRMQNISVYYKQDKENNNTKNMPAGYTLFPIFPN